MGLIFFKNNKPDNRMVEYDQTVVRLGLEKAALENDVEKVKRELKNLYTSCDFVRVVFLRNFEKLTEEEKKEVRDNARTIADLDGQVSENQKTLNLILSRQQMVREGIVSEEEKLIVLSSSVAEVESKKKVIEDDIQRLSESRALKEKEIAVAGNDLAVAKKELNKLNEELRAAGESKITLFASAEKVRVELEELNEIISVLQATNKQSLDVVASLAGERKRLQEKDDFLKRKEDDLAVYEKRVEKKAKGVGLDTKMIFK